MTSTINAADFGVLLRSARRDAFHWESLDQYAIGSERAAFERFLNGYLDPPPWQDWLDQVAAQTAAEITVGRVRVLAEPEPTPYQRWMLSAQRWYDEAGEDVRYMPRSTAVALGIPLGVDWWLIDDEMVILTYFTSEGEVTGRVMITEPQIVARYCEWRDLAVQNATAAEVFAAI